MKTVTVIPLKKGVFREDLTYFTTKEVHGGDIVTISLRNKKTLGLVVASSEVLEGKANIKELDFNLKKILEVKEHSIFEKEYLDAALETARYFVGNKSNVITSLIPAIFREKYDEIARWASNTPLKRVAPIPKEIKSEKLLLQTSLEERVGQWKTTIRGSFAEKKSVFLVLPGEHDIKIFYESLGRGIEQFTYALHAGLSTKKILQAFKEITMEEHPVLIIGTPPFLSVPRKDLGTIILEHESGTGYKTIARPRLDLRTFVEVFAARRNVKFIASDTLLSFNTINRNEDSMTALHPLSFRTNFNEKTEIIEREEKKFKIIDERNIQLIKETLARKKSVFVFSLRKGFATQTICKDCGSTIQCDVCKAPLVLYLSKNGKKRIFSCNRCKQVVDGDTVCRECGSWNLIPLGIGTETVHEYLRTKLGNKIKIFKLDKESAKSSAAAQKIIQEFEKTPGSILIGTEMTFFYLHEKIPLSIVASFDSLWSIPSFSMSERILQLILAIENYTSERIIIQTKNADDPLLLAIRSDNLLSFVREELRDRMRLGYPPFKRFIKISYLGNKDETTKAKKLLEELFSEYSPEIFSGFVARREDTYVTNALIKVDTRKWSVPEISSGSHIDRNLEAKLLSLPPTFEIFIDPEDLL